MKIILSKPYIKKDIILKEIENVLNTKWLSGGPTIERFEEEIKKYNGDPNRYYIAVSNGTVALELALLLLNNGNTYENNEKNEVIVPSWSWVATGFSIIKVKAKPVWCDINKFGVVDDINIEKLITEKTAAIMVVHQLGIPCDMDKINKLGEKYNIPIIEDAACAFGSEYKGHKIGTHTKNIVTYSFQAKKVLTTGEGGMIVVSDKEQEKWLRSYRAFGTNMTPYQRFKNNSVNIEYFDKVGGNYKMSDINAAIGIAHLKYVDEEILLRQKIGEYYNEKIKLLNLKGYKIASASNIPEYCTRYNWQSYHIIVGQEYVRNAILENLNKFGIQAKWDIQAIHNEPVINYRKLLPITSVFDARGIQLPMHAELTFNDVDEIINALEIILKGFHDIY